MTGGTDNHSLIDREEVSGVALEREVLSIDELISEIREGRAHPLPLERFEKMRNMPLVRDLELNAYKLTDEGLVHTDDPFCEK